MKSQYLVFQNGKKAAKTESTQNDSRSALVRFFDLPPDVFVVFNKNLCFLETTLPSNSASTLVHHFARERYSSAASRSSGRRSLNDMPADQIVLSVKASIAIRKGTEKKDATHASELLFDSMAQPLPPGARVSVVSGRQLLYRIGSVYVDVEIDRRANSVRAALVGQMLDSARPGHPLAGVPVAVCERGRSVARTLSNENGEFRLEFDIKNHLKLLLCMDRRHPVHLPLTNIDFEATSSPGKKRKASAGAATSSTAQPI